MHVGDIIDEKYEVLRKIGKGGMGVVYEGRHTIIGKQVALKFLNEEYANHPTSVTRFQREALAASTIDSEHIVDVSDLGFTNEGIPYLVMEHLEGDSLAEVLERDGHLEPPLALNLVSQACSALSLAHEQGIVHRDLKPGNLFLTHREDGAPWIKILDFGIAKFKEKLATKAPSLTASGATLGTPYYMSPEQASGEKDIDHRADIYAMGVILYELLTGERPYKGESAHEVVYSIATKTPTPPTVLRPSLDPTLERIILRAMARERDDRHQSMAALGGALSSFSNEQTTPVTMERHSPRTIRKAAFVLGFVALVALTLGITWLFGGPEAEENETMILVPEPERPLIPRTGDEDPVVHDPHSESAEARLEVKVFPVHGKAQIEGDGEVCNPCVKLIPVDDTERVIRAIAEGHKGETRHVKMNEDLSIEFHLEPFDEDHASEDEAHVTRRKNARARKVRPSIDSKNAHDIELTRPTLDYQNPYKSQ